ncbi:hypothetical protein JVX92_00655 [Microbacterium hominis]|uniref:hypothetical protein n=1 Tax=Microbacterium hominis TaxID=162426 RepID=UPI0019622F10|nr:hypothetical protein [Microbacterium hominis]QRY40838.1 hypothetical protein JVX92_00655 [Microbacterium hominis]
MTITIITPAPCDEQLIALHPEIAAAKPAWADEIRCDLDDAGIVIAYYGRFGTSVGLGCSADLNISTGEVTFRPEDGVTLYFNDSAEDRTTVNSIRQEAAEMLDAADALENGAN